MEDYFVKEKSEVELRNILIILSILLVLFRLPLFAVLHVLLGKFLIVNDIRAYARYINFSPVVVLLFYAVKECSKRKLKGNIASLNSNPVAYFFIVSIIIGFCYTVVSSFTNSNVTLVENIRKFAPHNYFLIFPLLLIYLRFDENDYFYIINRIVLPALLVVGGLLMLEYLGIYYWSLFSVKDVNEFLGGHLYLKELNPRPSGILLDSASTAILLVACVAFQYSMLISKNKSSLLIYLFIFSISIGIFGVFIAASLYPLMIMIFVIFIISIVTYRYSFLPLLLSTILIVLIYYTYKYCLAKFALTNLFNHFSYYFDDITVFAKSFAPQLLSNFPFFYFPENHLLDYVSGYELLICVPWLIYVYSPIAKIARIFRIESAKLPSLMLCLVYIMATLHYSGLEKWGCNYLYSLAVLSLFVKSNILPDSKPISDSHENTPL